MALSRKIFYPSLWILASLVIIFGIYLAFLKRPSQAPVQESRSSWRTYNNDFIKMSLSYPSEWFLNESSDQINFTISDYIGGISTPDEKISQDHIKISMIRTSLLRGQTIDAYVSRAIAPSPITIKKQEEISIGDRKAEEFIFDLGNGRLIRGIYIPNGRTLYSFSVAPSDSIHMPIFDQMLQSFRIIEK
jgi:hypothetical protein